MQVISPWSLPRKTHIPEACSPEENHPWDKEKTLGGSIISMTEPKQKHRGRFYHCSSKDETLYYHYDGRGNVTGLLNKYGMQVAGYSYDAFGNTLNTWGKASTNDYRFSTKETDASGLVYYGARYYNPRIGRWITKDPMGMIDGPNVYAFVRNNPVNYIDLWGLCGEKDTQSSGGDAVYLNFIGHTTLTIQYNGYRYTAGFSPSTDINDMYGNGYFYPLRSPGLVKYEEALGIQILITRDSDAVAKIHSFVQNELSSDNGRMYGIGSPGTDYTTDCWEWCGEATNQK